MKIFADYHTHTRFSHGTGSVEDNVLAAIQAGLSEIAISDHGCSHIFYGVPRRSLTEYLDAIHRVQDKYAGRIKVLAGMECNICSFDGRIDLTPKQAEQFDFLILGYHKAVYQKSLGAFLYFDILRGRGHVEKNTLAYLAAIQKNRIHLGLHD